jgi:Ca2+-binding EF-hand superfamily protein
MCFACYVQPSDNTLLSARAALLAHFVTAAPAAPEADTSGGSDSPLAAKNQWKVAKTVKAGVGFSRRRVATAGKKRDLKAWRKEKRREEGEREQHRVRAIFDEIDSTSCGHFNEAKVVELLGSRGTVASRDAEAAEAMADLDQTGDGMVTFKEFSHWWGKERNERGGSAWASAVNVLNREMQQKEDLEELFDKLDSDGGGTIDVHELRKLTADLGLSLTTVELQEAMRDIDDDDDNEIEFAEFYEWFKAKKNSSTGLAAEIQKGLSRSQILKAAKNSVFVALEGGKSTVALRGMFDRLDDDGSGSLGKEEIIELVQSLRLNLSKADIDKALQEMDKDGDNEIDFEEFEAWWVSTDSGLSGKLRSQVKLSGFLANTSGNLLVATEIVDENTDATVENEAYLQDLLSSSFGKKITLDGVSLKLFAKDNPFRIFCRNVMDHKACDIFLVGCIFVNLAVVASSEHFARVSGINEADLGLLNLSINIIFTVEALMRIVAQGFCIGQHAYVQSRWNGFDLVIVIVVWTLWVLAKAIEIPEGLSRVVSILRSFRALRFLKHIRQMMTAINTSLPTLLVIGYGLVIMFVVFGVLFHALFNGALTQICWDEADIDNCARCVTPAMEHCSAPLGCEALGLPCFKLKRRELLSRQDHTDKYGFDTAEQSLMTMFTMSTLDDWQAFSNAFREGAEVHAKTSAALGFFVIVVGLLGVNFFLSAIAFSYIKVRSEARKVDLQRAAEEQVAISLLATEVGKEEREPPRSTCLPDGIIVPCDALIKHPFFEAFILLVVMLNIFVMASDHYPKSASFESLVEGCELVFFIIYVAEAVLKLVGLGLTGYLKVGLNRLDILIVIAASLSYLSALFDNVMPENLKDAMVFRILRMTRLLRAARVGKILMRSDEIRRMMKRAFAGRAAILSLTFLLMFFLGIMAIIAEELFKDCARHDVELTNSTIHGHVGSKMPRPNYSTFGSAFVANFVLLSTDSWTALAFEYMECSRTAAPYFIFSMLVLYFVLSNLFVAVFFESFELDDDDKREQQIKEYLEESAKTGAMNVLDVRARLDTVNDFLGATRSRLSSGGHVGFNAFVSGVRLSERTAKAAAKLAPSALTQRARPRNCFLACCGGSNNSSTSDALNETINDTHQLNMTNPIFDEDADMVETPAFMTSPQFPELESSRREGNTMSSDDQQDDDDISDNVGLHRYPSLDTEIQDSSCGLLTRNSHLRKFCVFWVNNFIFRYVVIAACIVNTATVGIDEWRLDTVDYESVKIGAELLEALPAMVFLGELVFQFLAKGVLLTPEAHLGTLRGFFEFVMMFVAALSIQRLYPWLRPARALISLRLLYLVSRASTIVETVGKTIPAVWTACAMIMASFLIFGIVGIMFLAGKMWYCDPYTSLDKVECLATNGEWRNRPYNFDNIIESSRVLFIVWSMQGWIPLFLQACDCVGIDKAPVQDANKWHAFLFFASFMIWNSFMLTKLFLGMLADFFASSSGNLLLTDEQRNWQFLHLFIYHVIKVRTMPLYPFPRKCFQIAESTRFIRFIDFIVVINVIQLVAVAAFPDVHNAIGYILVGQWIVIVIYTVEAVIKVFAYGPLTYWKEQKLEIFILAAMYMATIELAIRSLVEVESAGWIIQALQATRVLRLATVMGRHSAAMRKMYYTVVVSLPQVRKTPSWPRSWANFSLLQLYSHRNAWANLHLLGQPNTFVVSIAATVPELGPLHDHRLSSLLCLREGAVRRGAAQRVYHRV